MLPLEVQFISECMIYDTPPSLADPLAPLYKAIAGAQGHFNTHAYVAGATNAYKQNDMHHCLCARQCEDKSGCKRARNAKTSDRVWRCLKE